MPLNPASIKVAIADDHPMIRRALKSVINSEFCFVGEASNGLDLVNLVNNELPDVVICDIRMPLMNGIDATRIIRDKHINTSVVAFTVFTDDYTLINMLEAGAIGYLTKNSDVDHIKECIYAAYMHQPYYCRLHDGYQTEKSICESNFNPYKYARTKKPVFTKQELRVMRAICMQHSNRQIADELFLSIRTVECHRAHILEKINVVNPIGIVIYALRHHIIAIEELP